MGKSSVRILWVLNEIRHAKLLPKIWAPRLNVNVSALSAGSALTVSHQDTCHTVRSCILMSKCTPSELPPLQLHTLSYPPNSHALFHSGKQNIYLTQETASPHTFLTLCHQSLSRYSSNRLQGRVSSRSWKAKHLTEIWCLVNGWSLCLLTSHLIPKGAASTAPW